MIAARSPRARAWRRLVRPAWLFRGRPVSDEWGFDRGTPIDRHYIELFLAAHASDIRGRVLEVQDSTYTERFGRDVARRDVLDLDPANPRATLVADLATANAVPDETFDCFVLTQTLHLIRDLRAALAHARRMLVPGGVLLATVPSVSRVSRSAAGQDHWRFTPLAARSVFGEAFGAERVSVEAYGSYVTAVAFLAGRASEELSPRQLSRHDPFFPVLVGVRAVRG